MNVCVFCKNCILRDEDYSDCSGAYMCKIHPNKKVIDPIMGTPTYLLIERNKKYNNYGEIDGYDPDQPYECCEHYNLKGDCSDFERISKKEEKKKFGKTGQTKSSIDSFFRECISEE